MKLSWSRNALLWSLGFLASQLGLAYSLARELILDVYELTRHPLSAY